MRWAKAPSPQEDAPVLHAAILTLDPVRRTVRKRTAWFHLTPKNLT